MGVLKGMKPESVFHYFEEISAIPHGSNQQGEIGAYLTSFAKERNLNCRCDEAGNVIIWKGASAGYETAEPVILQGHMDMVAVKDEETTKDLQKEGLDLEVQGDRILAKGTSLGGDDGIALAMALAILDDDSIPHPPLEAVFTANEEIGMLGAIALDVSDLKGRMLLNMDSEEEGSLTVSCAGGVTVVCSLPYETEETEKAALRIRISGLKGGHSGTEIHKNGANANILLGYLLSDLRENVEYRLISMNGGEKDNAIAESAEAYLVMKETRLATAEQNLQEHFADMQEEYKATDPAMQLTLTKEPLEKRTALTDESTKKAIMLLRFAPHGVENMSPEIPDMVLSSENLGILRTEPDGVKLTFCVRSADEQEKKEICNRIRPLVVTLGGTMETSGDYPSWEYCEQSRLRDVMTGVYKELLGEEPRVVGMHAGLECGIFASKIPGLDAVSFGPQMYGIHTTKEELSISSVQRTWELLLGTFRALS